MNLVHILSSIGEFETDKTKEFIHFTRSLSRGVTQFSPQPRHIVTDREVILFIYRKNSVNYYKHAVFMAPLIVVICVLLLDIGHSEAMASYEESAKGAPQPSQRVLSIDTASSSATFSDIINQASEVTPTPTQEIIQPIITSPPPSPTILPTVAPVLQIAPPSDFTAVYQAAGAKYGIPWQILYGLHLTESGLRDGPIMNAQGSGARGPMQFMPGTWRAYGVDGNGDGIADIDNAVDAIYGAAHYLSVHGTLDQALTYYGTNKARVYAAAKSMGWNG